MLKVALAGILTTEERLQLYSAFDIVGDIVIVKIPDSLGSKKQLIANAILQNVKPARSVFAQVSPVKGQFRIRSLEFLAGENRTVTEYREHGCRFKVDIARTYFSPRLSTERLRIARIVNDGEVIINMFGGVGTYSIIIAKINRTCKVYNIDSNPTAISLCEENAKLNKVQDRVEAISGDASEVIESQLKYEADRVLMPLPEKASDFVDTAVIALRTEKSGTIHYFAHVRASSKRIAREAGMVNATIAFKSYNHKILAIKVVREVGPRVYQVVCDVSISV